MPGLIASWALRLWPLWLGIGLVVVGAIWLNVHDARVAREARAEVEARLSVCDQQRREAALEVDEARRAIDELVKGYSAQAEQMAELARSEAAAKTRGDKAVQQALAKEKALRLKIDELKAEAAKPAASPELSCDEADAILRDLAARRAGG